MMCFQLFVAGDQLGALNMYSRTQAAFDGESQDIGLLFASDAAVALACAEHEANLRAGMDNRDVIGQAKGILMERHKLTADQAFGVLVRVSQEMNRKLVAPVTERLLPDDPHLGGTRGGVLQLHGLEPLVHAEPAGAVVDEHRRRQQLGGHIIDLAVTWAAQWKTSGMGDASRAEAGAGPRRPHLGARRRQGVQAARTGSGLHPADPNTDAQPWPERQVLRVPTGPLAGRGRPCRTFS